MYSKTLPFLLSLLLLSGNINSSVRIIAKEQIPALPSDQNPYGAINEIPVPQGFERLRPDAASFAAWLQKVSLKKDKTVYLYNGRRKPNQSAQFAVLDISTGNNNLQQCADAVMRLRAEYLFASGRYGDIHFIDNEGKRYQFAEPFTHRHLLQFMETVFAMCGSASLEKQLHATTMQQMQIGDVLIKGGFPGHAVIVMDMAKNPAGKKMYLLAQGFMPAQDMHVLKNPNSTDGSPWYRINDTPTIQTPEYLFKKNHLRRW